MDGVRERSPELSSVSADLSNRLPWRRPHQTHWLPLGEQQDLTFFKFSFFFFFKSSPFKRFGMLLPMDLWIHGLLSWETHGFLKGHFTTPFLPDVASNQRPFVYRTNMFLSYELLYVKDLRTFLTLFYISFFLFHNQTHSDTNFTCK